MTVETEDDVAALKRIGKIVSYVLHDMLDAAEPGMTTLELDSVGGQLLERLGARSVPKLTYDLPGSTCISNNGIGAAIQQTAKRHGFKIIENLGSHGIGRALHQAPEPIAGYFDPTAGQ